MPRNQNPWRHSDQGPDIRHLITLCVCQQRDHKQRTPAISGASALLVPRADIAHCPQFARLPLVHLGLLSICSRIYLSPGPSLSCTAPTLLQPVSAVQINPEAQYNSAWAPVHPVDLISHREPLATLPASSSASQPSLRVHWTLLSTL